LLLHLKLLLGWRRQDNLILYRVLARAFRVFALRPLCGMQNVIALVYKDDDRE